MPGILIASKHISVKPSRNELLSKKNHLYVVFRSSLDIAKVMQIPTKRDDQAKDSQNVGTKTDEPNHSNLWTFGRRREMSIIKNAAHNFNLKQPTCSTYSQQQTLKDSEGKLTAIEKSLEFCCTLLSFQLLLDLNTGADSSSAAEPPKSAALSRPPEEHKLKISVSSLFVSSHCYTRGDLPNLMIASKNGYHVQRTQKRVWRLEPRLERKELPKIRARLISVDPKESKLKSPLTHTKCV